jgi:uncharacterized pyridoxal phosphate-dependent enzyme
MTSFNDLGIKRIINASGNNSRLGSSVLGRDVLDAMCEASKWYVNMGELQLRCGEFIAKVTGAEAGLITSGAAGGLLLATAACITGKNRALMLELPQAGAGREVIIQKGHRTGYDQAVRNAGPTLIEVGLPYQTFPEQIEYSINEKTVAILFVYGEQVNRKGEVPLETVIEIARRHGIPIIVDGSLINYPFERIKECLKLGVDIIVTSGGKHIFGPAGTGFLCGRKDLVEACRMQCGPEYGIGRPMKVGKEEMIGLITAIENYIQKDHESEQKRWEEIVHYLAKQLIELPNIEVTITDSDEVDRPVPRAFVRVDEKRVGRDAQEIVNLLRAGDPPMWVQEFNLLEGILILNPVGLLEGDEELILKAFRNLWFSLGLL